MNQRRKQRYRCNWWESSPSIELHEPIQNGPIHLHRHPLPIQWCISHAKSPISSPNPHQAFSTMGRQTWKITTFKKCVRNHNKCEMMNCGAKTTHESGNLSALSAWPGTSIWMKQERSLISVMHGLFTNSWNDASNGKCLRGKVFPLKYCMAID